MHPMHATLTCMAQAQNFERWQFSRQGSVESSTTVPNQSSPDQCHLTVAVCYRLACDAFALSQPIQCLTM
jgi:hypothetical protein